eukprot:CAMPEP_0204494766 /NCGR_PEP_ID=MMETSP0471-20130131/85026_1 /ASSEMBLY_ACC=CAM_ASM_000602 /TAXON_ID=2969 /ORGANISM="Oxyrrhis marina" /LENGTH=271 /DNA_ID=CAMNT_0051498979 /DNA_START=297 /DNA_END=1114 /DNA_ORIENTATION=+
MIGPAADLGELPRATAGVRLRNVAPDTRLRRVILQMRLAANAERKSDAGQIALVDEGTRPYSSATLQNAPVTKPTGGSERTAEVELALVLPVGQKAACQGSLPQVLRFPQVTKQFWVEPPLCPAALKTWRQLEKLTTNCWVAGRQTSWRMSQAASGSPAQCVRISPGQPTETAAQRAPLSVHVVPFDISLIKLATRSDGLSNDVGTSDLHTALLPGTSLEPDFLLVLRIRTLRIGSGITRRAVVRWPSRAGGFPRPSCCANLSSTSLQDLS